MPAEEELRIRGRLSRLSSMRLLGGAKLSGELRRLQRQLEHMQAEPTDEEIWHRVELARHPDRPYTLDYVERILEDWVELHGDRGRADDAAVVTGLGRFGNRTIAARIRALPPSSTDRVERSRARRRSWPGSACRS